MKVVLYGHESFWAQAIFSKKNEGNLLAQTPSTYKSYVYVFDIKVLV
jgi:hypothetical protein